MDKVFSTPISKQFEFDESVASVFDDMLNRSVPLYEQSISFITSFISKLYPNGGIITDLGCSTANTLLALFKQNKDHKLYGIDNSEAMLNRASQKVQAYGADITLICADILNAPLVKNDVIIANYMLQFIRPLQRSLLVKKIYENLNQNGVFIFSEKIIYEDKKIDKMMIDIYLEFKKSQGYSDFEISQKREALENILVPYTESENIKMIKDEGFKSVETIIKWGNFSTFLACK